MQIKPGKTMVGNAETSTTADIRLGGEGILDEHCFFESEENGTVHLHALEGGTTMVNGQRLNASQVYVFLTLSSDSASLFDHLTPFLIM